jgi:monoamine oxidase
MSSTNPQLSRRKLLKYGLLSSAAALSAGSLSRASYADLPPSNNPQKVTVIGAGLAGLSAAHQLVRSGHEVTILEARRRPGGRVYTLREPFADGLYAEAGAFWIADNHDITLKYINLFDLPLVPNTARNVFSHYYGRGKSLDLANLSSSDFPYQLTDKEVELGYGGIFSAYFGPALEALSRVDLLSPPDSSLAAYDRLSVADYLLQQGASRDAVELLRLGYFDVWGDGVGTYSALQLLRDLALNTAPTYYQIEGGNDRLPQALAAYLSKNISYESPVHSVQQTSQGVQVDFLKGGYSESIVADYLICTVPLSVLDRIHIWPALSQEKQQASRELAYTSVTRVMLQAKSRFWQEQGLTNYTATDLPVGLVGDATFAQDSDRGIIESLTAGNNARQIAALPEATRQDFVLPHLEKIYPEIQQQVEASTSISWDADEWAQGGYVWFQPNQMIQHLPHIAKPEGRIYFAGEHTSPWNGWMQGALNSGERVAQEIHAAIES